MSFGILCSLAYRMGHNPARKGMGGKFIIEGENDVVEVEDDEDGLINQHQLPHNEEKAEATEE